MVEDVDSDDDEDGESMIESMIKEEGRSSKTKISFIKQFMIEFEFLKAVSAQEIDRVRDLIPEGSSSGATLSKKL